MARETLPLRRLVTVTVTAAAVMVVVSCTSTVLVEVEEDACGAITCQQPPEPQSCYLPSGSCEDGTCVYAYDDDAACDDGDACTESDTCARGVCSGTPLRCDDGRPPECIDGETLRSFGVGGCTDGECEYPASDETCPNGCFEGACNDVRPSVVGGAVHTCALSSTGRVRCWGDNGAGQLGYGHIDNIGDDEAPASAGDVDVGGVVIQLSASGNHTCALLRGGTVRCWGDGGSSQLGYGTLDNIGDDETPASAGDIDVGGPVQQIAAGNHHTCALLQSGSVRCWGRGDYGSLGYGNDETIGDDETPASAGDVDVGGTVVQISASSWGTCVTLTTGSVRCWGHSIYGALGYPGKAVVGISDTPVSVGDVDLGGSAIHVSHEGYYHTCALLVGGTVRCWGQGHWGALGYAATNDIGDDEHPSSAGDIDVGGTVAQLSTGWTHTCARLTTGAVRCWGNATEGQLGQGGSSHIGDNETPASAGDIDVGGGVALIACGAAHTCAQLATGAVRCWGRNDEGQLGYGHTDDEHDASQVSDVAIW